MSPQTQTPMTAEQLARLETDQPCELVDGELIMMSPAGPDHGRIANTVAWLLTNHVRVEGLGTVYAAETGFLLQREPDTVRAPDVAFVRRDRLEAVRDHRGFLPLAPDLAVEVVSPDDRPRQVEEKAHAWIEAGAPMVWLVWPQTRSVSVLEPGRDVRLLHEGDTLTGGDVVSGFSCHVNQIFE